MTDAGTRGEGSLAPPRRATDEARATLDPHLPERRDTGAARRAWPRIGDPASPERSAQTAPGGQSRTPPSLKSRLDCARLCPGASAVRAGGGGKKPRPRRRLSLRPTIPAHDLRDQAPEAHEPRGKPRPTAVCARFRALDARLTRRDPTATVQTRGLDGSSRRTSVPIRPTAIIPRPRARRSRRARAHMPLPSPEGRCIFSLSALPLRPRPDRPPVPPPPPPPPRRPVSSRPHPRLPDLGRNDGRCPPGVSLGVARSGSRASSRP